MSILTDVLKEEYDRSCRIKAAVERELSELPKGSISKKIIKGKLQYYLQYRIDGKMQSKYINQNDLTELKKKLAIRKELKAGLKVTIADIARLEKVLRKEL